MGVKVHFLGTGGSGISGAAAIAQSLGFEVTGCDLNPHNEFTTQFKPDQLFTGHSSQHLSSHIGSGNVDILALTPAIFSLDPNNPELLAAKEKGITVMTYLTKDKFVIAVCGTHGKTTTTAMIAKTLEDANLDPTAELGAIVPSWKSNYRIGKGKYFVVEADEFNDNFLHLKSDITIVTNIEMDHPEYFENFEAVKESFKKFLLQTKQTIVANLKDPAIALILKDVMKQTSVTSFDYSNDDYNLNLKIPGEFNKLNASAAFRVGLLLGLNPQIIKESLQNYTGVGRRFEYIGDYKNAQVYSDFGHHPTEIKKTMEAARQKFPKQRIVLVYQPHMFSRTKALFNDFIKVFGSIPVNKIILTDIYPSREADAGLVHAKDLVDTANLDILVYHSKNELVEILGGEIKPDDVVFFMGAGDIDKLARKIVLNPN
ncbi:MAG: UDP-N-acetylmuramate-L-alanine ligase [Candidatus Daviesbacteria bacterium GW2011_GWF2_38_7]|nr:MAG: UDP-N-acetylmuramate-L-alanine ligase [Candidatus Daviesbacteria bacterium GW2011_GWF2_38_7]